MLKPHCDAHPDRPAVTTVVIEQRPAGYRPAFLFGYQAAPRIRDLCFECHDTAVAIGLLPTPPADV